MDPQPRQPAIDDNDVEPAIAVRERLWRSLLAATLRAGVDALITAARMSQARRALLKPAPGTPS